MAKKKTRKEEMSCAMYRLCFIVPSIGDVRKEWRQGSNETDSDDAQEVKVSFRFLGCIKNSMNGYDDDDVDGGKCVRLFCEKARKSEMVNVKARELNRG